MCSTRSNFQLYGAIAATKAVLPAMREAGAGTLLYTTGAGSIDPDAAGRQRQRRRRGAAQLGDQPAQGTGRHRHPGRPRRHRRCRSASSVIPGLRAAPPEQISPVYWDLHTTKRDEAELVFSL